MYEKFLVYVDDAVVGVKYNHKDLELTIGGFARHRYVIVQILESYFTDDPIEMQWPQINKIKFTVPIPVKIFSDGIGQIRSHGFIVEPVTTLRRLIR